MSLLILLIVLVWSIIFISYQFISNVWTWNWCMWDYALFLLKDKLWKAPKKQYCSFVFNIEDEPIFHVGECNSNPELVKNTNKWIVKKIWIYSWTVNHITQDGIEFFKNQYWKWWKFNLLIYQFTNKVWLEADLLYWKYLYYVKKYPLKKLEKINY